MATMNYSDRERLQSEDRDYRGVEFRRFELTATLTEGSNAACREVRWSRTTSGYALGATFTVYDGIGAFTGSSGDKGWAIYCRDSRRWEIWQLSCS